MKFRVPSDGDDDEEKEEEESSSGAGVGVVGGGVDDAGGTESLARGGGGGGGGTGELLGRGRAGGSDRASARITPPRPVALPPLAARAPTTATPASSPVRRDNDDDNGNDNDNDGHGGHECGDDDRLSSFAGSTSIPPVPPAAAAAAIAGTERGRADRSIRSSDPTATAWSWSWSSTLSSDFENNIAAARGEATDAVPTTAETAASVTEVERSFLVLHRTTTVPVFVDGWRQRRYPIGISCPGVGVGVGVAGAGAGNMGSAGGGRNGDDNDESPPAKKRQRLGPSPSSDRFSDFRARFCHRPTLRSLLRQTHTDNDQEGQGQKDESGRRGFFVDGESSAYVGIGKENACRKRGRDEGCKLLIRSDIWTDFWKCQWRVLIFPLGSTSDKHVAVFLERVTPSMERHVSVSIALHRPTTDAAGNRASFGSTTPPPPPNTLGAGVLTATFCHRYPAVVTGATASSLDRWGQNEAFGQAEVLRECVDDGGMLGMTIWIFDVGERSGGSCAAVAATATATVVAPETTSSSSSSAWRFSAQPHHRPAAGWKGATVYDDTATAVPTEAQAEPAAEKHVRWKDSTRTREIVYTRVPFVGLLNQGATCYMNSLLQVWYHLPAYRRIVLNLPVPDDSDNEEAGGYSDEDVWSDESSCSSDASLFDLTTDKSVKAESANESGEDGHRPPTPAEIRVGHGLQLVFARLSLGNAAAADAEAGARDDFGLGLAVPTQALTDAFGWDDSHVYQQQDVQELSRVLMDRLEAVFRHQQRQSLSDGGTCNGVRNGGGGGGGVTKAGSTGVEANFLPGRGLFPFMFEGKLKSYVRCTSVPFTSWRLETFLDVQLQVKGCPTLLDSLKQMVHEEDLVGENRYDASDSGYGKQDAKKGVRFHTLPPVLNVHLKRFEYDPSFTSPQGATKVHDRFEFPIELDLCEFVVDNDESVDDQGGSRNDQRRHVFHLHSILMHHGGVKNGHYTAYVRPDLSSYYASSESDRKWYHFNDHLVSRVQESIVLEMAYGSAGVEDRVPLERGDGRTSPDAAPRSDENWQRTEVFKGRRPSRLSLGTRRRKVDSVGDVDTLKSSEGSDELVDDIDTLASAAVASESGVSAYMLAYIRESDLTWVLQNKPTGGSSGNSRGLFSDGVCQPAGSSGKASAAHEETYESACQEYIPRKVIEKLGLQGESVTGPNGNTAAEKEPSGPYVTVPFATDEDLARFDSIEGAYIPRFSPKENRRDGGYICVVNDFCLWDGHVPTSINSYFPEGEETSLVGSFGSDVANTDRKFHCRHRQHPERVRLRIDDSGYAILRLISAKMGVPMHCLRLWGTKRRKNGTIRVEVPVRAIELKEWTVEEILVHHLDWAYVRKPYSSDYRIAGQGCTRSKLPKGYWIRPHGRHGFYVEVLPPNRTTGSQGATTARDSAFLVRRPFLRVAFKSSKLAPGFYSEGDCSPKRYEKPTECKSALASRPKREHTNSSILAGLCTFLDDDAIHEVYKKCVPDVAKESALLFFKRFVSSGFGGLDAEQKCGNVREAESLNSPLPSVRYIGSALFHDIHRSTTQCLQRCARQLIEEDGLSLEEANSNVKLLEIIKPRQIETVSTNEDFALSRAELFTGDLFVAVVEPRVVNNGSDRPFLSAEQVIKERAEQIWIHFLPLTARDAFSLKRMGSYSVSRKLGSIVDKKTEEKRSKVFPLRLAASLAVLKSMLVPDILQSLWASFLDPAKVPSPDRLRLTLADVPTSSVARFCVCPPLSSRRESPLLLPPPPEGHPLEMPVSNIPAKFQSSSEVDQQAQDDEETDRFDARWLTELSDNLATMNKCLLKRIRHHYVFFDVTPISYSPKRDASLLKPVLFPGRLPNTSPSSNLYLQIPNSSYLPLLDLIVPIRQESKVQDALKAITHGIYESAPYGFHEASVTINGPPVASCTSTLMLTLTRQNRIIRVLPVFENLHDAYRYNWAEELPRGKIEAGCGVSDYSRRAKGKKKWKEGAQAHRNLYWNAEARGGCIDIGGSELGTLVLQQLPLENSAGNDSDANGTFSFPCVVPLQAIFYLDESVDGFNFCFLPVLTFLRRHEGLDELRRRISDRLCATDHRLNGCTESNQRGSAIKEESNVARTLFPWTAKIYDPRGRYLYIPEEAHINDEQAAHDKQSDTHSRNVSSLWRELEKLCPCAFRRGGGIARLFRHLYQLQSAFDGCDSKPMDQFRCEGHGSDLPTIAFEVPRFVMNDLIRCRASLAIGSAQHLTFDVEGKLVDSLTIPTRRDVGNEEQGKRRNTGHGVGIEIHR